MRTRQEIETSGTRTDLLMLEVLLDLRSLLEKLIKSKTRNTKNAQTRRNHKSK